jgi:SAM-dependent methyltransferase
MQKSRKICGMESGVHQADIVSQFTRQARPFAENKAHSENRSLDVFRALGCFSGKERLLDSGCGPGLVSIYLAEFVAEVIGVDLTPAMVELAAESARKSSISNVNFLEGNMTMLPFPDDHFDVSVSRYAFHHLENPRKAFAEMLRVTRPGGKIIVLDVTPEPEKRENYDRFERLRDPSHTSALTTEELTDFGMPHGLTRPEVLQFGLEMDALQLINSSFPESVDRNELLGLLAGDVGKDSLSFQIRQEENSLIMTFPLTAAVWWLQ